MHLNHRLMNFATCHLTMACRPCIEWVPGTDQGGDRGGLTGEGDPAKVVVATSTNGCSSIANTNGCSSIKSNNGCIGRRRWSGLICAGFGPSRSSLCTYNYMWTVRCRSGFRIKRPEEFRSAARVGGIGVVRLPSKGPSIYCTKWRRSLFSKFSKLRKLRRRRFRR